MWYSNSWKFMLHFCIQRKPLVIRGISCLTEVWKLNLDGSLVLWLSPLALPVLFSWCSSFHSLQNNSIFQIQKVMTPTACIFISFYVYIVYVQVCVSQEKLERSESYLNLSVLYFPCKQSYSCIGTTGDTIYTKGVKYNYL